MSKEVTFMLVILSMVIWMTVSKEAAKPSIEIKRWKMVTLLIAGSLSTFVITFTLLQSLSFPLR